MREPSPTGSRNHGPLKGLKVIDFSTNLPGPLATLMLAEAGATVLKIEPPAGDPMQWHETPAFEGGLIYQQLNRGKHAVRIDLKDPPQRRALEPLIREADVLVEGFRPGAMDKLGLGFEAVKALNPGIVYCSVTGFGQGGPRAREPGHEANFLATVGLLPASPTYPAPAPQIFTAGVGAAYAAVTNILLALRGQSSEVASGHLDIAMVDSLYLFGFEQFAAATSALNHGADPWEALDPRYSLYTSKDGAVIVVAADEEHFWTQFCDIIDLPEGLRDDSVDPAATVDAIAVRLANRDAEHWRNVFAEKPCCVNVSANVPDALADPQLVQRGLFSRAITWRGRDVPALPVPVAPSNRSSPWRTFVRDEPAQALGETSWSLLLRDQDVPSPQAGTPEQLR